MATFALIHGGGGSAWDWHLVAPLLRERGHIAVAVDLPSDSESAGWWDYADAVVKAVGDRSRVVVVGHSLGGFTAPLVCARMPVDLLVLVAGMIPAPGEIFEDWWTDAGYEESGADSLGEPELEGVSVSTFRDAALMTNNDGVVLTLRDGSEFQLTIIQSRESHR